jgi:hypothetical protein
MKKIINLILAGCGIAFILWTYQNNQIDPVMEDPEIRLIVEEWKRDMNSIGLNGDKLIKRVDRIMIVKQIPSQEKSHTVGKSDHGTRTIWIRERQYEPEYLKALVYHELGHYLFDLKHLGTGEIMSKHLLEEPGYYKKNWDNLLPIYLDKCKNK